MRFPLVVLAGVALPSIASAQLIDRRYAEEPTDGVAQPTGPIAGEHDARAVVLNPGGLALLRGPELALALDLEDTKVATAAGGGFGTYFATAGGGGWFPHYGIGMALEWLRPPRAQLDPDPSLPFRFTMGLALGLGANTGLGVGWHHFHSAGELNGVDTFDLGLSGRVGSYLAFGANVKDLATASIGGAPVQRRYELELVGRPLGSDRLDLAVGGRIGETRHDVDGWARISARVARGTIIHGVVETRALHAIEEDAIDGIRERDGRDIRATLGLELSFGSVDVLATATGMRDDAHARHFLGGSTVLRVSDTNPASVLGHDDHIERIDLAGDISARQLTQLVMRMRAIARDPSAKGVVVTFDGATAGWATLEELRNEVLALKRANKKVFAYMVSGTGRDYFVASAADKIYVDPAGGLRIVGIAGTSFYLRGAFDWLGVEPQFEKIAEYKSAPEMFTETGPTEIAAKMHGEMFDSIWTRWVQAIADGRKLSVEEVKAIVDAGPYTAGQLAVNTKLVDAVAVPEKVAELVAAELGGPMQVATPPTERPERWSHPGAAVIYIDGDITDGTSKSISLLGQSVAGGQTIVAALAAARADPKIGAIILRIDSPGGSALASELISREVFATRGVKPILCSMSNYAASGGYFVAAGCDLIYAEPMTITGSIGIFYGKFDLSGLLRKLGITTDTYKRGKRADVESLYRPFTDEERAVLLDQLRYSYGRFVGAVAEGRGMKKDEVDGVGRGHVYTGEMAKPLKLVDRFGGLGDALDEAKQRMGLSASTKIELVELPETPPGLLGTIGDLLGLHAATDPMLGLANLTGVAEILRSIPASILVAPESAQARLPVQFSWR